MLYWMNCCWFLQLGQKKRTVQFFIFLITFLSCFFFPAQSKRSVQIGGDGEDFCEVSGWLKWDVSGPMETVSHQCMTAEEWEGCAGLCLRSLGERSCKALESCCWALMPQTLPVCFAQVGAASALEYLCSGLKDLRVHTWNGNPIWIQCGGSQILHSNTRFATWSRQLWQFFLAIQGKQEMGFSRDVAISPVIFSLWCVEGVCGCHIVCKRAKKEETCVFSCV